MIGEIVVEAAASALADTLEKASEPLNNALDKVEEKAQNIEEAIHVIKGGVAAEAEKAAEIEKDAYEAEYGLGR